MGDTVAVSHGSTLKQFALFYTDSITGFEKRQLGNFLPEWMPSVSLR